MSGKLKFSLSVQFVRAMEVPCWDIENDHHVHTESIFSDDPAESWYLCVCVYVHVRMCLVCVCVCVVCVSAHTL